MTLMRGSRAAALAVAALAAVACGGKRTDAEHLLFRWAEALNVHLAGSFESGNEYPHALAEIDPMMRAALTFDDPWGEPLRYRRIDDGHYDIASAGPNGVLGDEDDLVVHNGLLQKPGEVYARRPAAGMKPQSAAGEAAEEAAAAADDGYGDDGEELD